MANRAAADVSGALADGRGSLARALLALAEEVADAGLDELAHRDTVALAEGLYKPVIASGELLLFYRESLFERMLIALNMGPEPVAVSFPDEGWSGRVLLSSFIDREGEKVRASIDLRGNEGLLVIVDSETPRNWNIKQR